MKDRLERVRKQLSLIFGKEISQFIAGSSIIVLSSLLSGFLNYLYHLFMGRMLGPSDYGVLSSLLSLFYIFGVPMGTFSLVVTKFSVDHQKGEQFFQKIKKTVWGFTLGFLLFFTALAPMISSFLHLGFLLPILLVGFSLSIGFLATFEGAILQGKLKFLPLAISGIAGTGIKLLLGIIFVYFGLGINGAVFPIVLMVIFNYLYFCYFLRKKETVSQKKASFSKKLTNKEIWNYAWPTFFFTLSFALLYSIDVILARHFLSSQQAGWYGALSTLSKIIYFLIGPLSMVLFPMAAKKRDSGESSHRLFRFSFFMVILASFLMTSAYFLFPNLILKSLYGPQFLSASRYLGLFSVFLSLYSLAYFLGNFMLSQGKTKAIALFSSLAVLLQVTLIYFFHQGILQILQASIFACGLLFLSLLVYYIFDGWQ